MRSATDFLIRLIEFGEVYQIRLFSYDGKEMYPNPQSQHHLLEQARKDIDTKEIDNIEIFPTRWGYVMYITFGKEAKV